MGFEVPLVALRYFYVAWGTLGGNFFRYIEVPLGMSRYFEVPLGITRYFEVPLCTSMYF